MLDVQTRLAKAVLYLVCDERPDSFVRGALRGGVDVIQLRMKNVPDRAIASAAERFKSLCEEHGALFILNDRPDLAAAAQADGVHVGQDDMAPEQARAIVGPEHLVGISTHTPEQIDRAPLAGADYIGVGPVYPTPTKPGRPAVGTDLVRYATRRAALPWFAIGGINADNVAAVYASGARRIAVVRAIGEAADPERAASKLRRALLPHHAPLREERAQVGSA